MMLRDPYGRLVDCLRVSVTDRCDDAVADMFRVGG
jgi:molybdenum cofactor biosynthesis enzyme MoaA